MPLRKPPIVEMWIEFCFEPNPKGGLLTAVQFLEEYHEQFPELEFLQEDRVEFRQVSPTKLPEVVRREIAVKHIRAHDGTGSSWLHVTPTQMVCNFLRLGEKYPGFESLSKEAVGKLKRYLAICSPGKMKYAAIHYVDVIDVPFPESGQIALHDYFTLGLDLPAVPFGNQGAFQVRTTVMPPDGTGPLDIQLQLDAPVPALRVFRFRMDWHKVCPYDKEVDLGAIDLDLKRWHDSVMPCFRAAFMDRAWELFGPEE